jgi:hypothetical protein
MLKATLPLQALTSINKMSSVYAISFDLMMIDFFFPISEVSLISSSTLIIDNFPNNKSLKPHRLALAKNLSLQIGHSSALPQKRITLIAFISVIQTKDKNGKPNKEKQDKTKFQLDFQQVPTIKRAEKPSNNK